MKDIDLVNQGKELFDQGRYEDSINSYNEALKINELSKEAKYNKGISLLTLNKPNEALECI